MSQPLSCATAFLLSVMSGILVRRSHAEYRAGCAKVDTRRGLCAAVIAEKLTGLGVFIPTFFLVYVASQPQNLCAGLDLMCSCAAGRTYGGAWMPRCFRSCRDGCSSFIMRRLHATTLAGQEVVSSGAHRVTIALLYPSIAFLPITARVQVGCRVIRVHPGSSGASRCLALPHARYCRVGGRTPASQPLCLL